ncbi:MAG: DUF177 domain-containing protein [Acidobacteriota bacterium]|nr:DUF177 domain-containing protein [Acidobacteriota bacterium]
MKIWLDQVREETFDWSETQNVPVGVLERPELLALGPVEWRGRIEFADPGFLLRARLSYEQTLHCNRCLQPIVDRAGAEVDLLVLVERPRGVAGEQELHADDLGVLTVFEEVLDTQPLLLEQLQLNIPMKPLCRTDCQGLCPECGADRNTAGACSCAEHATDPRWAALASLRRRLGES